MTDITPIATTIIALLGAIITVFVIPVLRTKLSAEKRQDLLTWIQVGCKAAEQLAKAGIIDKDERKQHVLDFLNNMGIDINLDEVMEMIEAVVNDLPPFTDPDEEDTELE